jgi:hypothetical protein
MDIYFDVPTVCPGCVVSVDKGRVSLRAGGRSVVLDYPAAKSKDAEAFFVVLVAGKHSVEELTALCPGINVQALLRKMDEYDLLVEAGASEGGSLNGKQLISRLEQEHHARIEAAPPLPLWAILESGRATPELLTGLATEYYFLTASAYDAVTPAVARLHGAQKLLMIDFVLGEYRHDKLMLKSLKSCSIPSTGIDALVAHPYTVGLTDMLRYWAETDPLTLMCSLFIVEGTEQGGKAYIEMLKRNALPDGYLEGIIEHDRANAEGNHGAISREFMRFQGAVSAEDAERVSYRLASLHRLMRRRNQEITWSYADAERAA